MKFSLPSLFRSQTSAIARKDELKNSVLDTWKDGVMICDAHKNSHCVFYANPALVKFYACNHSQIIGQKLLDFFQPWLSEIQFEELSLAIDSNSSEQLNLTATLGKEEHIIQLRIEPMYKDDGSLSYLVVTHSDITSIQMTERALHESNQKLKELLSNQTKRLNEHELQIGVIFDQAMDPMILLSESSQILDANDAALSLFSQSRTDLLGLDISSLFSELGSVHLVDLLTKAPLYQEVSLPDPLSFVQEGSTTLLAGAIRYISIKQKKYIVITLHDRSAEHLAKLELKKQQTELEKVVRNLNLATQAGGIGIWSWDFELNEVTWDDRMYSIYGVDPAMRDNTYTMWQERVHPEDIDHAEHSLLSARENLTQFNSEFRILLPSGNIRWVKAAADVIFAQDGITPIGMGGVNIDITKEKNAQDFLRNESEAAQAANEAKSMFLANMSHEIRTPMNGVVGMLSLLSETELQPDQKTMINTIKDSALTLLHIINDILDFSKIEAGQMSLESVPVELQTLMERTIDVLHLQASNKGIEIYLTYDSALPKMIMSDSVRISQIMLNLLGNAVKFTESHDNIKGKIWLSASLGNNGIAPCVNLSVEDNGIGMSAEQQRNLFNAFTQADTSTTRLYGGTGLGLSITQSLLSLMGGSIAVESALGEGSRFSVELPFIAVDAPAENTELDKISSTRALVISDDNNFTHFCNTNLNNMTNKVHSLSSIPRALKVIEQAKQKNIEIDTIILGPDIYNSDHYANLKPEEYQQLDKFKRLQYTKDVHAQTGIISPSQYTVQCSPFKPSELINAIGILNGLISPVIKINEAPNLTSNKGVDQDGLILVIDDQPTNRDVLQRQLTHLGYECEMAVHGQEALQMWKNGSYDLILTDCHMPVMDGYEFTKQVRQLERNEGSQGHIPIIAITANAMKESSQQCMSSGMDDYLTKPVELDKLGKVVKKWLKLSPSLKAKTDKQISTQTVDTSPICLDSLEKILGTADLAIIGPLLADYWDSVSEDIEMAENALSERNEQSLQQIAHAAKGAAKSAGAQNIASIFESIQDTALDKDWHFLSDSIQESRTESARLKHYLLERSIITDKEVSL